MLMTFEHVQVRARAELWMGATAPRKDTRIIIISTNVPLLYERFLLLFLFCSHDKGCLRLYDSFSLDNHDYDWFASVVLHFACNMCIVRVSFLDLFCSVDVLPCSPLRLLSCTTNCTSTLRVADGMVIDR